MHRWRQIRARRRRCVVGWHVGSIIGDGVGNGRGSVREPHSRDGRFDGTCCRAPRLRVGLVCAAGFRLEAQTALGRVRFSGWTAGNVWRVEQWGLELGAGYAEALDAEPICAGGAVFCCAKHSHPSNGRWAQPTLQGFAGCADCRGRRGVVVGEARYPTGNVRKRDLGLLS